MPTPLPPRIILGISGASGAIYGVELLKYLQKIGAETHLIISKSAQLTIEQELNISLKEIRSLANHHYAPGDIAAPISSGSFYTSGMIIAPCSMKTLAEIATGITGSLLSRAADVTLKERRRLVLMARETPLNLSHIENMLKVTQMGGIIAPPVPAFYTSPKSIDDLVQHSIMRVLDLFDITTAPIKRWEGMTPPPPRPTSQQPQQKELHPYPIAY